MPEYTDPSDLRYIDQIGGLAALPNVGPDSADLDRNWDQDDKLEAAQVAEAKLESDVNDGERIDSPETVHGEAAAAWATHRLVLGLKAPDAATYGDVSDEGGGRMAFADRVKAIYQDHVEAIEAAGGDEGSQYAVFSA